MTIHQRITDLGAEEIIGDLCAAVGSRYWCIGMRVEIQKLLDAHKTDHEGLSMCVSAFRQAEGWKALTDSKGKLFASYADFCKTKRPHGLGCDPAHIDLLVNEGRQKTSQERAADPELKQQRTKSEAMKGNKNATKGGENGNDNVSSVSGDYGNSASYLVRRLKRDAPEIAEALARGEYPSARAAGIAAGIVKVPTALENAKKAAAKLSKRERQQFRAWLDEQEQP